ncbi:MAG: hypothetical protein H6713_01600 [Myxococcales bacterium]|nr:hypothetical protein [Myxococcales bacterium]
MLPVDAIALVAALVTSPSEDSMSPAAPVATEAPSTDAAWEEGAEVPDAPPASDPPSPSAPASATEVHDAPATATEVHDASATATELHDAPALDDAAHVTDAARPRAEPTIEREPPPRVGEGLMITGWSLLGGGVTLVGVGIAYMVASEFDSGFGVLVRAVTVVPTFGLGGGAALLGAGLAAGGYGKWRGEYTRWAGYPAPDPRGPAIARRAAFLLMPGGVLLSSGVLTFGLYGISDVDELVYPAAIATASGALLLAIGLVRRANRPRVGGHARLAPSLGRTRHGAWTTGLVVRW